MITGIQVSSLKPLLLNRDQVYTACRKMQRLGCDTVQLQWIDSSVSAVDIAQALAAHGIKSVSVQDFYETVIEDLDYYTALNSATGGTWLCVSRIPERLKSPEGLKIFVLELRSLQEKLSLLGQQVCFHPVSEDFTAVPGIDAVTWLLGHMPELTLCLDLYHLNRRCPDMPGFIRRYAGRICMVHFKDSAGDILVPAGQGDTDWRGVVSACLEAGVSYGFVEQERWDRDPYQCLHEALRWLRQQL